MTARHHLGLLACATLALAIAACGGEKKQAVTPKAAPATTSRTFVTSAQIAEPQRVSPTISVADEILAACKLRIADIESAPKFEFDKSDLMAADKTVLREVGACLTTGPLAGRAIALVGRADPRGTEQYNMALGARRANNVAVYLGEQGVTLERMTVTSRGELDAVGIDEDGWQLDRRVDILLDE